MRANHLKAAEQRFLIEVRYEGHTEDHQGTGENTILVKEIKCIFHGLKRKAREGRAEHRLFLRSN